MTLQRSACPCLVWAMLAVFVPDGRPQPVSHSPAASRPPKEAASELTFDKRTHERKLREAKAELETVREARAKVSSYQSWVFWLGIALIALGLCAACAQILSDPWNKRVTTVLAALVVAVTTTKTGYFQMESKAIDGLVGPADDAIKDHEKYLGYYRDELHNDSPDQGAIKDYLDRLAGDRATLLQVHEALRAAGLSLGFATPLKPDPKPAAFLPVVHAQSVAQTSMPSVVTASGSGECNDSQAAREYARCSALEALARKAVKGHRREDLDALIDYLGQAVRLEKFNSQQAPGGMTRYSISYSIPPEVLDQAELQVGAKRDPFIQWASNSVTVSRSDFASGKFRRIVSLQASKATLIPAKGKFFDIHLDLSAADGRMMVDLVQADTHADGSVGSTRWAFEVLVNGQMVISVPSHRYSDVRKPTICRIPAIEQRRGEVPLADRMNIQVNAYSPR